MVGITESLHELNLSHRSRVTLCSIIAQQRGHTALAIAWGISARFMERPSDFVGNRNGLIGSLVTLAICQGL